MDKQLYVASFFSGAGGLDLGFSQAGFKIALANDLWQDAMRTFKNNHPTADFITEDIRKITESDLKQRLQRAGIDKIHVVIGGPPCQCFTRLNNNNLRKDDERTQLFRDYIKMIKILDPDFVVMENVADLLVRQNAKGKWYLNLISTAFKRAGYQVGYKVFETERYGVPQMRRRVIFLATKLQDIPITFPEEEPKIATVGEHLSKLKQYSKLSNNEIVENGRSVKVRIKHVPQGGYYEDLPARLKVRKVRNGKLQIVKRYGSYFRRLNWNSPAITVTKNYIIHPKKNRYLTNREKATLHTFPPSYVFEGAQGSVSQQIANAVPPRFAYHIAEHIKKLYEQHTLAHAQSARSSRRSARATFELRAPKSEGRASRSVSANE